MLLRVTVILALIMTGCLRTRESLKEEEAAVAMRDQVSSLQKVHADSTSKLDELMDQNRALNGRIEELEFRLSKSEQDQGSGKENVQKNLDESKRQNELLQESISKMETQLQALQEEIVTLKSKDAGKTSRSSDAKAAEKDRGEERDIAKEKKTKEKAMIDVALGNFEEKKWKEAILGFDQYREKNPKGKYAAEATYKTGVCFQELGMTDEAKVFYQDVVAKFPQSDMAKKAQIRLKSLK